MQLWHRGVSDDASLEIEERRAAIRNWGQILVSLTDRSQLRYCREYIVPLQCVPSRNILIKGQFKIKDNLMEKEHKFGLSHYKCDPSVIIVFSASNGL